MLPIRRSGAAAAIWNAIDAFFATLQAANPAPQTELEFSSVFELLAAVLLSAQATDVSVNKATRKLFPVANTPAAILALGIGGLTPYIRTIGLFNSKAKHLNKASKRHMWSRSAYKTLPAIMH